MCILNNEKGFIFRTVRHLVSAEICIVEQNFRDVGWYVIILGQSTVMISLKFMCFQGWGSDSPLNLDCVLEMGVSVWFESKGLIICRVIPFMTVIM